jgi:hypothetical protein
MAAGDKPAITVAIKPVGGDNKARIYALAGWEREGKVGSMVLDRKIAEIAIKMATGEVVRIRRGEDGKTDHYFDFYDNRTSTPKRSAAATRDDDFGPPEGGDDIPF